MLSLIALLALAADDATGSFSSQRVRELVGESVDECFTGAPTGEARYSFAIAADGTVREVKLLGKKNLDELRMSCLSSKLERMQFPMTRGLTAVELTLRRDMAPTDSEDENGLAPAQIAPPVKAASDQIRECYEARLRENKALAGRLEVQFVIAPNGMVIEVAVSEDSLKDALVARCVQAVVLGLRFPKAKNGKPTVVAYPFVFASVEEVETSPPPADAGRGRTLGGEGR